MAKVMMKTLFTIFPISDTLPTISQATQMEFVCKHYANRKLTYQFITLMLTKLFSFHILGTSLGNNIDDGMVYTIFITILLCKIFPMVS